MQTADIRSSFLEFFIEREHRLIESSALIPASDPTLLFTNAGMVQFKDALLGRENRDYSRATSCQRCVRAGGKHNDLENVGYTARHHTLFEMLGNFSFGDYFKEETISWAWEYVTEVLELPVDKLWVTVHPTDDEARDLWIKKIGVDPARVVDHEENFWAMGDTGPCGPDSELFFDQGPELAGGPPGSADEDGDRFLEFWNLVFPQFDRAPDGTLAPLPTPGVDTGMGLERVAAIKQGVKSNYEIDVFRRVITEAGRFAGFNDENAMLQNPSLRVIADHIRSASFLMADGVMPGSEERSYVLRRVIRRALRHGNKLDINEPFFHRLVAPLVEDMSDQYPLLKEQRGQIEHVLMAEEERFATTLSQGMELLEREIADLSDKRLSGDVVFKLYDTFGFPADLTADVARERGLDIDEAGFDALMEQQRARGRAAGRFDASVEQTIQIDGNIDFLGYGELSADAEVVALFSIHDDDVTEVDALSEGDDGIVILNRSPFYAEAGGQVGDTGSISAKSGAQFLVSDTTKGAEQHLHRGSIDSGTLRVGDSVATAVVEDRRADIARNHSATHLLHAALKEVLGSHVEQKGSRVDADRLRFDFSHPNAVTVEEIKRIEAIVNARIRENSEVQTELLGREAALAKGATALFGEKYGDEVRVLTMGAGFSVELCGGTHVARTGDIGILRITSESGTAAGVRRVEAVSGRGALAWIDDAETTLSEVSQLVRGSREDVGSKVADLVEANRMLAKELEALRGKLAQNQSVDLADQATEVSGVKVLGAVATGEQKDVMKTLDGLRDRLGDCIVVLGRVDGGKVSLTCGVSKNLTSRIKAGDVINYVGGQVGAKGGGRPDMARAGGGDKPDALPAALESLPSWVSDQIGD